MEKRTFQPSFDDEEGLLKLNHCWMGRESWYATKKLFNLPFLTLKVSNKLYGLIYYGGWL